MSKNIPTANYPKNLKAIGGQKSENKSPLTRTESKPAFNLLKNKVTEADSTRLQKATRLLGRVSLAVKKWMS